MIKLLVENGANLSDKSGYSPLLQAVNAKNIEIIEFLLDNNADINTSTPFYGETPLLSAILAGELEIATLLVQYGAKITPYEIFIAEYSCNPTITLMLKDELINNEGNFEPSQTVEMGLSGENESNSLSYCNYKFFS